MIPTSMDELKLQSYATKVADSCYEYVLDILQVTRPVVEELSKKYKLVLVSNFYGNIQTILKDFGLLDFFDEIIESSVVGVRKPDPAIYRLGVDAINVVQKFYSLFCSRDEHIEYGNFFYQPEYHNNTRKCRHYKFHLLTTFLKFYLV